MQTSQESATTVNVKTEENLGIKIVIFILLLSTLIYCSMIHRVVIVYGGGIKCYSGYNLLTKKDISLQVGYYIGEKQCKTSAEFMGAQVLVDMAKSYNQ